MSNLNGRQPHRERAAELLRDDADEALNGAEHHAMDHDGTMLLTVRADIGQIKALGQLHVQLNGAALPGTSQTILEMEVDLRAVECTVAFIDGVVHAQIIQRALQTVGCHCPHLVGADGVFRDE